MSKYDDQFLIDIVNKMSVREKAAQLTQLNLGLVTPDEDGDITGPAKKMNLTLETLNSIGSVLNFSDPLVVKRAQDNHMANDPNRIPLGFMQDVIHGFKTVYPVPIALGCSFEPELVEKCCAMAAKEASLGGVQVTFAPMADLARDARWGRVVETTGEDPYMNGLYAAAAVRGFQGDDLSDKDHVAACLKHFAAYGAAEAGRDYNTVDMSERTLREFYLSGYKAAADAGVAMAMTSFNVYDGIPLTANKALTEGVLRKEWGWDGVIISDYNAFGEMKPHGYEGDGVEIAKRAFAAGEDIEMMSLNYLENMEKLIESGDITMEQLDASVLKVLKLKRDLGLFENPYRGADEEKLKSVWLCPEHRELARKAVEKCSVLLKNDGELPLNEKDSVALIGPFADAGNVMGTWRCHGKPEDVTTVYAAMQAGGYSVKYAKGCDYRLDAEDEEGFTEAIELAKSSDKVVMCIGEEQDYSGEGNSRGIIDVPALQVKLLKEIYKVNENITVVLFTGRPLVLTEILPYAKAIACVWQPGTECGSGITNLLFGKVNFSGKLSMTFPYHVAQCPIYYNHMSTGRPKPNDEHKGGYISRYIDIPNGPTYPYGYGLSYSEFEIGNITLSNDTLTRDGKLTASVLVKNVSKVDGSETVQMYIHDKYASRVRPVKELKDYRKIDLKAGESEVVTFEITENELKFWDENMNYVSENGAFEVFIGNDSRTTNKAEFELK